MEHVLTGIPPLLELPTERPQASLMSNAGKKLHLELPKSLSEDLKELSQREGVTSYMILLAAFKTLLYRYSGQSDIVVGSPIAGYNRTETDEIFNFFTNTLVLRTDLSGNPSFRELLGRIREVVLGAHKHQDLIFEKLVAELQLKGSLSHNSLFQVMFVFQNTPLGQCELPGLASMELEEGKLEFAMTLYVKEHLDQLSLQLVYQQDLFTKARVSSLLHQYQHLLTQIVAAPETAISTYSLVTPESVGVLPDPTLVLPQPEYPLVTTMFSHWAKTSPQQPAICQEQRSWNYSELSTSAHDLAQVLLNHGVKPGEVVAVFGHRSFGLIASMMGVFLSGGVLLTLDPKLPDQRQQMMLAQSKAKYILCVGQHCPAQEDIWDSTEVIFVNADIGMVISATTHGSVQQLPVLRGENAAYIFFTSGTTGVPKGILGCHKGLAHFLAWQRQTFAVSPQDRSAQLTGLSFDVVLRDIFLPLTSGATLYLPAVGDELEPAKILPWLESQQISLLHTVPALAQSWLLNMPSGVSLTKLRCIFFAGEPLKDTLVQQWREAFPNEGEIVNLYGPTETTLAKCYYQVPRQLLPGVQPVGQPLPQTQALVLGSNHHLCGIGEAGEIVIRTPFRSLGYINASAENRSRFVKNPFTDDEQDLVYYTGDRGRYRSDGTLEILGRLDRQVKIQGVRIELGEIEAILSRHPSVRQSVVIVREEQPGDKRLIAYIIPEQELAPTPSTLRNFLKQQLPKYMMPGAFVMLEVLPLTPNGKVDYRALPAPDASCFSRSNSFVAPRTPTEKVLASIWENVLCIPQVGIEDNFFALGGHSLLAMQVISRCRQAFSTEIPLQLLFEKPTIAGLAGAITQRQVEGADVNTHQIITPQPNRERVPLSFAQQRVWFLEQLIPDSATTYIMANALRLTGKLNVDVLQQSLDAIVSHHEVLRTNFVLSPDGSPIQIIGKPRSVELMIIDLIQKPEYAKQQQVQTILDGEAQRPFDLASDLMLRATLLKIDQQEHILLLVMHHTASDGSSMVILWKQLTEVYTAFLNGAHNPLPKPQIQYADFAIWQREWLSGERLDSQLDYWKTQLAGANQVLELPTDYPRPPVQTNRAAKQSLIIPKSLSESITALSLQEGVTLFMTLLAAFGTVLHRYTGQEDVSIGSPIAGRHRAEIEELIGFFINTVVLRIDFSGHPSFRDLLDRVRQMALGAYAHQEMPFEKLVEELQPERDTSRNPLFQVWFNMLNLEDVQLELPGLCCEPIQMRESAAKFDLTLYVTEQTQGIKLDLVYNSDLFTPERMMELLEQYHYLLTQIVINPQASITNLSLVTPQAKFLLPNPHQPLHPHSEQAVHTSFCQQAQRVPQQLAVVDAQVAWTYAELEERTNQLAHYLLANNIHSQEIVAIYAHRSAALVWAILGVLKAGCAFMILDPAYPDARLIDCLEIAQPRAWLNVAEVESPVSVYEYLDLSGIDRLQFSPDLRLPTDEPNVVVEPDHLAYVVFTSGSTGKPKGIKGTHRPLSHFLQWHVETFGLSFSDRFSMLSGLAHDPLLRDIFTPLSVGATLCIPRQEDIESLGGLADWMQQQHVSVAHLTPAMAQLLTTNTKGNTTDLRYLFFSGDVLTQADVTRIHNFAPQATCVNFYGATETPQAMGYLIIPEDCDRIFNQTIPVGRGIADVQLLVLNANLNLAGISELGEIYVRTPYLAQGYIGSDLLTQEKFIINPFTNIVEDRLYKTGDLGRYLPNGNIEFLGRIDHQVKIRGFRIELGEIEAILNQHPAVQETVVIKREDVPGEKQLVAYVVPRLGQVSTTNELRDFLKQKLPNYMIPSSFVILDALPLTPNNKVDRLALPRQESANSFVAPRSQLEQQLTQIWEEVLGIQSIGIKDNFFDLGGHSLLAIRLFAEIERKFGKKIPLAILFQAGTIETLAHRIAPPQELASGHHAQNASENLWSSLVAIQPKGSRPPLFCMHPLGGGLLGYYKLAVHLGLDQPVYGLQPQGLDGKQPPHTGVEDMASHYIREIQTIQPHGPYFLAGYSFGGTVAFEMAQQLIRQGEKIGILAMLDSLRPGFNSRAPFLKRIFLHLEQLLDEGPRYLKRKLVGWKQWGTYSLKHRYKHYLQTEHNISENNEHLEVIVANTMAAEAYNFQVYPGRITLLRTEDKYRDEAIGVQYDPQFGWGELAGGGLDIHYVPGDHIHLLEEPYVRTLAEKLKVCLHHAQAAAA